MTNVCVQSLGKNRASRNCSVRSVRFFILPMTFEKDTCPDSVQLIKTGKVNILDEGREEKVEVSISSSSSMDKVICCDTVEIINTGFKG